MEPPTLDGLLKELDIPLTLLDQKCSDEHLKNISLFLDWRRIAPHLGLDKTDIDEIESKKTNFEKRLETLQKWKMKYGYMAKSKNLVQVLLKVGNAEHAERVCQLLIHTGDSLGLGAATSSAIPSEQPRDNPCHGAVTAVKPGEQPPSTTAQVANITTKSLEQEIEKEIQELEDQFFIVVKTAASDLENIGVSMVILCITQLPVSVKYQHIKFLQENLTALNNAKSVSEIFSILALYWDFLNCGLLKEIVYRLGNYETKQLMEKYTEQLREFRMKTKLEDFIGKWAQSCPSHFSEVVTKLRGNWRGRTLEDLENFRIELARMMYVEEYTLHYTRIKPGSISVTWAIPSSLPGITDTLQSIFPVLEEEYDVFTVVFQGKHIPELVPLEVPSNLDLEESRERRHQHIPQSWERELLLRLQEPKSKQPRPKHQMKQELSAPTPQDTSHIQPCGELLFDTKLGGFLVVRSDCMFIASVGSEHPAGVKVEHKLSDVIRARRAVQTHTRFPQTVTRLPQGTEVDLIVVSSLMSHDSLKELMSLNLDLPGRERSKNHYLQEMEKFMKECEKPGAIIWYTGHSEHGTGNWCFKDGTISFQEIFNLYRAHFGGRLLYIVSDCCYSGKWVHTCAETLDNMGIPPCGHKAREQGVMIKILASCKPDQKAEDPCYSIKGVWVSEEDQCIYFNNKQLTGSQTSIWGDFTRLVCCKGPDDACLAEKVFKNWQWVDAVSGEIWRNIHLVRGKDGGWHYVLLSREDEYRGKAQGHIDFSDCGYTVASGWGNEPPQSIKDKIKEWTGIS